MIKSAKSATDATNSESLAINSDGPPVRVTAGQRKQTSLAPPHPGGGVSKQDPLCVLLMKTCGAINSNRHFFFYSTSRLQAANIQLLGSHLIKAPQTNFPDCPCGRRLPSRYSMFSPSLEDRCLPAPPLSLTGLEVRQCPEGQIIP